MEKKVEIRSDKNVLKGTLLIPKGKGPFPGVLFIHGSQSNRSKGVLAGQELVKKEIMSLAIDLRGHGESTGKYEESTLNDFIQDAQVSINFLRKNNLDIERLGIKGSSMGAHIASCLLKKNKIKSLLLSVPAAFYSNKITMPESAATGWNFLNDKNNWDKSPAINEIKGFKGSLLVVRNELDTLCSKEMVEYFYLQVNKTKIKKLYVLKGANHSTHDNPKAKEIQQKMTIDWFLKTL